MRIQFNKPFVATVLVLVSSVSLCTLASPITKASDVETTATIVATPDPIGVGQIIKLIADINPNPPTSPPFDLGFNDVGITITYPDGSNVTLGPFLSNAGGGVTLQFVPDQVGSYSVKLTFPGGTLSDEYYYQPCEAATNFTVQPEPVMGPVGSFTFDPASPEVDETVTFDASNSSDRNGNIISYEWDYGDQNTGSGVNSTHAYSSEGIYTVTLTIIDNDEIADIATKLITVTPKPLPPEASFIFSSTSPEVGQTVTFDASNSSDPDGMIINHIWNFGDGTTGTGMTVTHSYASDGSYTVTLTVTDNDSLTDTATKTISNVIPEFSLWIIIPLFMTATLSAVIVCKRLTKRRPIHNSRYNGTIMHLR